MFGSITHLFLGKPFEFYSPYTLDETYERLQDASERDKPKPSVWRFIRELFTGQHRKFNLVTVDFVDLQSYHFHVGRDVSKSVTINTHGEVQQDNSGVKVTGIVKVNLFALIFMSLWLILWIVIFMIFIASEFRAIPFCGLLFAIFLIFDCKQNQNRMYNQIHDILGKSKKKHIESP